MSREIIPDKNSVCKGAGVGVDTACGTHMPRKKKQGGKGYKTRLVRKAALHHVGSYRPAISIDSFSVKIKVFGTDFPEPSVSFRHTKPEEQGGGRVSNLLLCSGLLQRESSPDILSRVFLKFSCFKTINTQPPRASIDWEASDCSQVLPQFCPAVFPAPSSALMMTQWPQQVLPNACHVANGHPVQPRDSRPTESNGSGGCM